MNGHPTTDFLLAYPFWIVVIFAGQCISYLLLVDITSIVARRIPVLEPNTRPDSRPVC